MCDVSNRDGSFMGKETGDEKSKHQISLGTDERSCDGYDTVDAVCESKPIDLTSDICQPLNLSTKSALEEASCQNSMTNSEAECDSGNKVKSVLKQQSPVHKKSPMAVSFSSAIDSGEYKPGKGRGDESAAKNRKDESPFVKVTTPVSTVTPGPIYMPHSAEHHMPIRSSQMRAESGKSPRSPGGSIVLFPRRSQTYVDSAVRYSPSPAKGSPSPVKDKIFQIENCPEKEKAAIVSQPSRTKVKQLAAQLVAAVQGTPTRPKVDIKAAQVYASWQQTETSLQYESKLNLQVNSPRCQQKTVSVVHITSPLKGLKPECEDDITRKSLGRKEKNKRKDLPDFSFTFSEPLSVELNDQEGSDTDDCEVVEEVIVKSSACEAGSSLGSSINDQSVTSDTTFDDSRNSSEKPRTVGPCALPVDAPTDDSSLPEDDWGQESGVENLSDLKINVSNNKLSPVIEDTNLCEETSSDTSVKDERKRSTDKRGNFMIPFVLLADAMVQPPMFFTILCKIPKFSLVGKNCGFFLFLCLLLNQENETLYANCTDIQICTIMIITHSSRMRTAGMLQ